MKVLNFQVPKAGDTAILVQYDKLQYFYDRLHYHVEWQIAYILQGEGTLFIGNSLGRFEAGDVILLSSNLPHLFKNDSVYYSDKSPGIESISLFFNKNILDGNFIETPELHNVKVLFENAKYGLKIFGNKEQKLKEHFEDMRNLSGFSKMAVFLEILHLLSGCKDFKQLSMPLKSQIDEQESVWLNNVIHYTMENYARVIALPEIATVANLSVPAFCRAFKLHTRKTYIQFLNELRISFACELLKKENLSIAQVASEVGFNNLSNFNRRFKSGTGQTPSEYLKGWTNAL